VLVVRLNHRVLAVIGRALVVLILAGLVALRAQGSRLAQESNSHAARLPASAGERWFDKVPDRGCAASRPTIALAPAPALSRPASRRPGL
jgi:hypothetical protein